MSAGELPCPECGDVLHSPQGLGAHRQKRHGVAGTSPGSVARAGSRRRTGRQRSCPECGVSMRADNLTRHRRDVHGLTSPESPPGQPESGALLPAIPESRNGHRPEQAPVHVDDLSTVFVDLLYPSGSLPVAHLSTLFEWRDVTSRAIEQAHPAP